MRRDTRVRQAAIFVVRLAVTTAIVAFIIRKLGWDAIVGTVARAGGWWLVSALAAFFVSGLLGAFQWHLLLRNRGIHLRFARAFKLYFVGMFFNNFMLGFVAGDAVRVMYLRLGNESARAGFAATFLDRFAGFWAMTAFAIAASAALLLGGASGGAVAWVIGVLAVAFCAFVGVMLFLVSTRLQALFFRVLERISLPQKARIRGVVEQLVIDARDRHVLAPVAALSLSVQFLRVLVHILCAGALGVLSLSTVHYFFIFVPILAMTMLAPLPFGVREGIEGALFSLAEFKVEAAVVMGFLASLVGIAVSLLGAGFFLLGKRKLVGNRT